MQVGSKPGHGAGLGIGIERLGGVVIIIGTVALTPNRDGKRDLFCVYIAITW